MRVYLAPPEALRRKWKVDRDCSRRGYTTDQVLAELDRRESDSAAFIRPQQRRADMVVSFQPTEGGGKGAGRRAAPARRTCRIRTCRRSSDDERAGSRSRMRGEERRVRIPADVDRADAAGIEEAVWEKMHFARHLRTERLGEYTVGTELHRSETLAIVQVLVLYHLVTAKATVALGGDGARNAPVVAAAVAS